MTIEKAIHDMKELRNTPVLAALKDVFDISIAALEKQNAKPTYSYNGYLLHKCPLCGGNPDTWEDDDRKYAPHVIFCTRCDASTGHYDQLEKAIEAWNHRA